jgi:LysR family transcriptional regulator, glycine cleavage system transcriptional activator
MDWISLPPLAALRAFAAFAETGAYTSAGAALNVSHAAVGQQIRALEDRLGTRLVRREGRGAVLTPDGERLAKALETAFGTIRRAVDELTGADAARPLQLTMTPAFAARWLMPRLADFRHHHSVIELVLNPTAEVVPLAPGGVDLAIRDGAGDWPGLVSEMLFETTYVIAAAPSLIGDRRIERAEDLLDLPWLQEYGTDEVSAWLATRGVCCPAPGRISHLPGHLALEAMRAGAGVCATVRAYIEEDVAAGHLRILFEDSLPGWGYHIVTRPGVQRPPLRAFVGWLRGQAEAEQAARRQPSGAPEPVLTQR